VAAAEPILTLVVAMAHGRVIGHAGGIPWHLPDDFRHFKAVTMGKPIVMGRRTFESIGRPLPGRVNIVVTRSRDFQAPGCVVAHSLEEAIAAAGAVEEIMIIGGAELYAQSLARAQRIHLTLIDAELPGDTWFPAIPAGQWREVSRQEHPADFRHAHAFSFVVLERA
jgi:dihydrofolate reductase